MGLNNLMIHLVDIERPVVSKDAIGGIMRSWLVHKSDQPCRIQPLRGYKRDQYMVNRIHVTHRIYFDDSPDINNGDRLVERKATGDRHFEVRAFWDTEDLGFLWVADCEEQPEHLP